MILRRMIDRSRQIAKPDLGEAAGADQVTAAVIGPLRGSFEEPAYLVEPDGNTGTSSST